MKTKTEDIHKYVEQQTRDLEESLKNTGKTPRLIRRKRCPRGKARFKTYQV